MIPEKSEAILTFDMSTNRINTLINLISLMIV
ncbi:hypothetical protein LYNGBM3L_34980 [Moorena producens 3L]|uniref:Uncharacterized protein n=1 Tax=Moorena producens 3L TaxID=489825 RepID=F4XPJ4_9CYAN|nr:hypothetical protein LYNGBM3L_34980 [Moorena producens 3L]